MLWKKCVEKLTKWDSKQFFVPSIITITILKKEEQQELKITQVAESD